MIWHALLLTTPNALDPEIVYSRLRDNVAEIVHRDPRGRTRVIHKHELRLLPTNLGDWQSVYNPMAETTSMAICSSADGTKISGINILSGRQTHHLDEYDFEMAAELFTIDKFGKKLSKTRFTMYSRDSFLLGSDKGGYAELIREQDNGSGVLSTKNPKSGWRPITPSGYPDTLLALDKWTNDSLIEEPFNQYSFNPQWLNVDFPAPSYNVGNYKSHSTGPAGCQLVYNGYSGAWTNGADRGKIDSGLWFVQSVDAQSCLGRVIVGGFSREGCVFLYRSPLQPENVADVCWAKPISQIRLYNLTTGKYKAIGDGFYAIPLPSKQTIAR